MAAGKNLNMRIVLDTNILPVSVSGKSASHWLYEAFQHSEYEIAYTTEILAEYEEQLSQHWSAQAAETVITAFLELPNAIPVTVYYHLNLIPHDKDDNKFADCAFVSNADYLVTEDTDFNVLKKVDFPLISVVTLNEFQQIMLAHNLI